MKNTNKYNVQTKDQLGKKQVDNDNSEILNLKTENCQMKAKLLHHNQNNMQDVTQKNI